ncbi:hypothetical protein D1B31_08965 [Neobacillus notoginsengisoli]|uniref:YqgU-like 6-bladed beta-propeller domain-containing protein n=1 Tax=Neobacillus notoginsengisoli TaxID=1578198 RepID=A0A417YV13_9BACI|nr:hypothetical protein [Neobacillus notoginsengisoli]RHW41068.1 hypothetical protein D1B31_08965 [Neobacillus notoginsengisoli]
MGVSFLKKIIHLGLPARLALISLIFLTLAACSDSKNIKTQPESPTGDTKGKTQEVRMAVEDWKLPIQVPEGEFYKVFGWLDDSKLIFVSNLQSGSNLYSYSLEKGESSLILQTDHPIAEVSLNYDRTMILVHTSSSSYEAIVNIYDLKGDIVSGQSFPSTELHAEWNPYKNDTALIVAFQDDWSFRAYQMDTSDKTVEEVLISEPFVEWIGENKLAYLDWNDESPSFFAPLAIQEIGGSKETVKLDHIYRIESYKDYLLTVQASGTDLEKAVFTFYDKKFNEVNSLELPHLSSFSGWLVPYMDFIEDKQRFTVFEPLKSGEADTYTEGFTLAVYQVGNETGRDVIMEGIDNQPILSSPSGRAYLYGFRFERILNIESKKIFNLIQE